MRLFVLVCTKHASPNSTPYRPRLPPSRGSQMNVTPKALAEQHLVHVLVTTHLRNARTEYNAYNSNNLKHRPGTSYQVDVTAKVRAERHLVHVMCAERRLLLQLFPRHVLQHVVEDNPLLQLTAAKGPGGLGGGAGGGGSPLEALPAEWLAGDDWRPVLRDADKLATLHPMVGLSILVPCRLCDTGKRYWHVRMEDYRVGAKRVAGDAGKLATMHPMVRTA